MVEISEVTSVHALTGAIVVLVGALVWVAKRGFELASRHVAKNTRALNRMARSNEKLVRCLNGQCKEKREEKARAGRHGS